MKTCQTIKRRQFLNSGSTVAVGGAFPVRLPIAPGIAPAATGNSLGYVSPSWFDQGRVFYFCGYGCGFRKSHYTAWIYKGTWKATL